MENVKRLFFVFFVLFVWAGSIFAAEYQSEEDYTPKNESFTPKTEAGFAPAPPNSIQNSNEGRELWVPRGEQEIYPQPKFGQKQNQAPAQKRMVQKPQKPWTNSSPKTEAKEDYHPAENFFLNTIFGGISGALVGGSLRALDFGKPLQKRYAGGNILPGMGYGFVAGVVVGFLGSVMMGITDVKVQGAYFSSLPSQQNFQKANASLEATEPFKTKRKDENLVLASLSFRF